MSEVNNDLEDVEIKGDYIGRDKNEFNYYFGEKEEKKEYGILDEIFNSVIERIRDKDVEKYKDDGKRITPTKKIKLNFLSKEDQDEVTTYFINALSKVFLIEKRIKEEDNETQSDIASDIFNNYNNLKRKYENKIEILQGLFQLYTVPSKDRNPTYANLTRAFVLFFFEDCTIFEKTEDERI